MLGLHALNYLSEKVYKINDGYDEEDIDYELSSFFNELMKRRRNDDIEEGLQAGGVIYPDRAGFKICERDGRASHAHAQENASQYINGESSFSGEEMVGMINSRKNDPNAWMNLPKNGFTVRIVATQELLIFIFNTYSYNINSFQLNTIYKLFNYIKKAYEDNDIKYPYINFITSRDRFVFNERKNIDSQLEKLEHILIEKINSSKEKTR